MELIGSLGITDITIIAVIMTLLVVYAIWQGTGLLVSLGLSLPIAGFIYSYFPYHSGLQEMLPLPPESVGPLFFVFLTLMALWIIQRTTGMASGSERSLNIVITAAALTTLVVAFSYHVFPGSSIYDFGPAFDSFFGSAKNFFWIVALALLALFIL